MCLIVNKVAKNYDAALKLRKTCIKIAKKDIPVYKILYNVDENTGDAPYQLFRYERGWHYYQEGKYPFSIEIVPRTTYWNIMVEEGLHSYIRKPSILDILGDRVVKMYIPKGAKYILGRSGDIVSDQLIWK
jgi:hypothetical protein